MIDPTEWKGENLDSDDITLEEIRSMVCLQLGLETVQPEDHFTSDLGAESADLLNLVASVEDRYDLTVGEDEIADLQTVKDLWERARRK
ncbi:MAG: phosphopantetheine-binding protein [Acidobacteriota bacterium]